MDNGLRPKGEIICGLENLKGGVYLVAPTPLTTPFFHKIGDVSGFPEIESCEWLFGRFFDGLMAFSKTNGYAYLAGARGNGDFSCGKDECAKRFASMFHLEDANPVIADDSIESESDFRQMFLNGSLGRLKIAADSLIGLLGAERDGFTVLPKRDLSPYALTACDPVEAQQTRLVLDRFEENDCVNFTSIVEENAPFTLARMENNGFSPTPANMFAFIETRCLPYGKKASRDGSLLTFEKA